MLYKNKKQNKIKNIIKKWLINKGPHVKCHIIINFIITIKLKNTRIKYQQNKWIRTRKYKITTNK